MTTTNLPLKAFLFAAFVFIPFLPASAEACSCSASFTPWLAELSNSDAVFVGKVRSVVKIDPNDDRFGYHRPDRLITFEIGKAYKGVGDSTRLISIYSDYEATSCGFAVDDKKGPGVGEKWIVFASQLNGLDRMFFGGSCNGSRRIRSGSQIASIEKAFSKYAGPQGILGAVVLSYTNLATDIEVEVAGEGVTQRSKPDADGYYWFPLEKPGKYTVTIKVPFETALSHPHLFQIAVNKSPAATTFVYEVEQSEGQVQYDELNVRGPVLPNHQNSRTRKQL